ncbi:hypothetical protein [Methylobacterium sp. E-045]|uniref:hypothetical protein n=1 Tax=Methylobacterium sp. E-045 TaxID=2836575 RepID=UPI001FB92636|nr:hypothetical protein [Methylobacterium sp. E-045]MCJ2132297.1 hypothetical protein [Methylobacterium sp. E-045]
MLPIVPAVLAAIFDQQVTVSAAELCRLLPMSSALLRSHIKHGNIDFIEFGFGRKSPRRFTLEQVMRFISSRSFREVPYPIRPNRQAIVNATPVDEGSISFRIALREEKRRKELLNARRAEWSKLGPSRFSQPLSLGLDVSPLAKAARKRLREDTKAQALKDKEAAAHARQAKKDKTQPPPGEDFDVWKTRMASERKLLAAKRTAAALLKAEGKKC